MAPGVCLTSAATPPLPLPVTPVGQVTVVPSPTWVLKSELIVLRCLVTTNVVPLPSARSQTVIAVSGSFIPSFVFAIAGSFHFVILPRKIPLYASRESLRDSTPGRLYASTTLPAVKG